MNYRTTSSKWLGAIVAGLFAGLLSISAIAVPPLPGAIFTTDSTCTGVNLNIYASKDAVYLDGGPAHPGAAGLPDGEYYVQVTEPDGTLLGTSIGTADETPVVVAFGEFASCYQLSSILNKASDGTPGYDDTTNPGGEYKVWVSSVSTFDNDSAKTDNFKVNTDGSGDVQAELIVDKFYDVNVNGVWDDGEPAIDGWKVRIRDGMDILRFTPVDIFIAPDIYIVSEFAPIETNWFHSTADSFTTAPLGNGTQTTIVFGNVCVGAGGGLTLGFWSNRNGQALVAADDLAMLVSLNLRNGDGSGFDPTTYALLRTWLLNATATNMSYMLSAQLAAMELNVYNGKVSGGSLIYAPGTTSANALGFATVNAVMAEADAALGLNGLVLAGSPVRSYQEALKIALDKANNNLTFVQATPCAFSFAP